MENERNKQPGFDTNRDWLACEYCGGDIAPGEPFKGVHRLDDALKKQEHYIFHPYCWPNWRMIEL